MKSIKTVGILAILLLGTGTAFSQSRKTETMKGVEKSDNDKKIEVDGVGHKLTYNLNGGVAEVEGGDNTVTIKGSAKKISVSGTGNKVYIDKVDKVAIEGGNNIVYYRTSGTKSGKPDVSLTGVGNKVVKQ
ncbi:hypothetical protein C1637_21925 [Chryseobacterium lactis]|uniref:DUF3060 domain-containing protein n=1 Tax=Chryseobacterium lactis TaxID=1241981 RepID=A0A3G6RQ12_CHRLC|nr:DUF3060 domain-containing protein [Chryseobacterium lactis]AZA84941.1 DUF3060 domain-containing protein [Chryseobacterium lactis]AZB05329.1 DUF3060 domain-containing protein [Chryseobacterium lactis]PNW11478.1 hypothetical protein C1637_21925 [Chryseobacterium lactis]